MHFSCDFKPLLLEELRRECAYLKAEAWRFVQMLAAVSDDEGNDLYYSFMKDGELRNYVISGVPKSQEVPSISDLFLASFVFENEARELFGVNMGPIAIDFSGALYAPAVDDPMTFMNPEQKEAIDKLRKANAAKAAKEAANAQQEKQCAQESSQSATEAVKPISQAKKGLSEEQCERIRQKMAELPAAKAAKLQAVLDREASEAKVRDEEQNTAAKVEGDTTNAVVGDAPVVVSKDEVVVDVAREESEPVADRLSDESLDKLLSLMEEDRAKIVLDALRNERA